MPLRVVAPMIVNFLSGEIDGARRHSLAEHDVDPEVFHDRIDEFLDRAGESMDLVDEEDRAFGGVGQEGHDVHLLVEGRAARDVELDTQLVVQDGGEGRLAEAGGTVEEDVGQGLAPFLGGGQADRQALGDGALADDLAEALRPELLVDRVGRGIVRTSAFGEPPRRLPPARQRNSL